MYIYMYICAYMYAVDCYLMPQEIEDAYLKGVCINMSIDESRRLCIYICTYVHM
jgi:hypothetical protein